MATIAPNVLVSRALHEVFGEREPSKRRANVAQLFTEDCLFIDHDGESHGHDQVDRAAAAVQKRLPDFVFTERRPAGAVHSVGRLEWSFGPRGSARPIHAISKYPDPTNVGW